MMGKRAEFFAAMKQVAALAGCHVLVVDDEPVNLELIREILEMADFQVSVAANGKQAVELAGKTSFDVILMDIQMPELDGFEAARIIGAQPGAAPIVAMTGNPLAGDREKCLAAGMVDHLAKPLDTSRLFALLAQHMRPVSVCAPVAGGEASIAVAGVPSGLPKVMPGLDLSSGMARVGGNEGLYLRLLESFRGRCAEMENELRQAVGKRDWPHARRIVHALKGVAGNISAQDVWQLSQRMEKRLEEGAADDRLFDQLLDALKVVQGGLAGLFDGPKETEGGADCLSQEELVSVLRALQPMLVNHEYEAVERLEDLSVQARGSPHEGVVQRLSRLSGAFDFNGALQLLAEVLPQLEREEG